MAEITDYDLDKCADIEELRSMAKTLLAQVSEEDDEQIEQRIMTLEARLDQRDGQIANLQAALEAIKGSKLSSRPSSPTTEKKRNTSARASIPATPPRDPNSTAEPSTIKSPSRKYPKAPVNESTGSKGAQDLQVGRRCTVQPSSKSGTIRFVGKVSALPAGYWVGVELDEATGRNNGTVKGIKLFSCGENYGTVLRPSNVEQL